MFANIKNLDLKKSSVHFLMNLKNVPEFKNMSRISKKFVNTKKSWISEKWTRRLAELLSRMRTIGLGPPSGHYQAPTCSLVGNLPFSDRAFFRALHCRRMCFAGSNFSLVWMQQDLSRMLSLACFFCGIHFFLPRTFPSLANCCNQLRTTNTITSIRLTTLILAVLAILIVLPLLSSRLVSRISEK